MCSGKGMMSIRDPQIAVTANKKPSFTGGLFHFRKIGSLRERQFTVIGNHVDDAAPFASVTLSST